MATPNSPMSAPVIALTSALVVAVVSALYTPLPTHHPTAPPTRQPAASGAALYKSNCAMCHGTDGSASTGWGKAMGLKPLSSPEVQKMSDADLEALILNGKGKMQAYKGRLTSDQVTALAKYVHTLK
jgi:mono/diheme cytochrome c family protein